MISFILLSGIFRGFISKRLYPEYCREARQVPEKLSIDRLKENQVPKKTPITKEVNIIVINSIISIIKF